MTKRGGCSYERVDQKFNNVTCGSVVHGEDLKCIALTRETGPRCRISWQCLIIALILENTCHRQIQIQISSADTAKTWLLKDRFYTLSDRKADNLACMTSVFLIQASKAKATSCYTSSTTHWTVSNAFKLSQRRGRNIQ